MLDQPLVLGSIVVSWWPGCYAGVVWESVCMVCVFRVFRGVSVGTNSVSEQCACVVRGVRAYDCAYDCVRVEGGSTR